MEQGSQHKGQPKSKRESLGGGPNPRISELPKSKNRTSARLRAQQLPSSEEVPTVPSKRKTSQLSIEHGDEDGLNSPVGKQRRPDPTLVGDQRRPDPIQRNLPVSKGHIESEVIPRGSIAEPRSWKPDVLV